MSDLLTEHSVKPTVLIVDDEKNIRRAVEHALENEGIRVLVAHDPASAVRILHETIVDAMVLDINLGEIDGLTFFKKILADGFSIPTVFISGTASLSDVAQAIKLGGHDFVEKPFSGEKIALTVKRALEYSQIKERLRLADAHSGSLEIVGQSASIKAVIANVMKVAKTNASVLITGESGTGKELVANALHTQSTRSQGPLVKVNCSAIPENLVESELFGYERGAFTGANTNKRGLFEMANRGTLFLDEVADLSIAAQAKVLRVLQNGEIQKVGSEKIIKVDVRIVCGTHKDLKKGASDGTFREDLFYRLNVVPIKVPSLRDRTEDIPMLVKFFSKRLSEKNNIREKPIDDDVFIEFQKYSWPGNVRELQNVLERIMIMSGDRITTLDLPEEILAPVESSDQGAGSPLKEFRDKAERDHIISTIKKHNGNITQSATELGVGRTYLHKRLVLLNITKRDYFT